VGLYLTWWLKIRLILDIHFYLVAFSSMLALYGCMKKYIFIGLLILFLPVVPAHAQTTPVTNEQLQDLLNSLLAQVVQLMQKLLAVQQQQLADSQTLGAVQSTVQALSIPISVQPVTPVSPTSPSSKNYSLTCQPLRDQTYISGTRVLGTDSEEIDGYTQADLWVHQTEGLAVFTCPALYSTPRITDKFIQGCNQYTTANAGFVACMGSQ
jgi:hypothetical protein